MCLMALVAVGSIVLPAQADPLPGRDLLKFAQEPMIATQIQDTTGTVNTFFGHDEFSTAYGYGTPTALGPDYQGRFMADDFADNFSSPVVHVKWWGSYIDDNNAAAPQPRVQRFLIAFESDVPANNPLGFSHPGCATPGCNPVLQFDVVEKNPLAPGSGTFTETLVPRPAGDPLNEALYEYNAELHLNRAFFEQKDTVYWLKIVALVDLPQGTPIPPFPPQQAPPGITRWGWHNRDYTIQDPLASPVPVPGEVDQGPLAGTNASIWHFQDDSVQGDVRFLPFNPPPNQQIFQFPNTFSPQHYVSPYDGPGSITPGVIGIDQYSKDLAFRLYTTQIIPEPASCVLLLCGSFALALVRRR
jgi:hypothetical protein